jgi:TRAP-type C4-dicarboxylate transport system substrate-binding protein
MLFPVTLAALVAAGVVLAGCTKKDAAAGRQSGPIVVTLAGVEAQSTGQSRMMQEVADKLNASGRFKADVQVNGALSGDTDNLVAQAKSGVPLVVPSDPGRLAAQFGIPDLNILMAPYVLTDISALDRLPDTGIFKEWQAQLEAQGVSFVADVYNGFRSFYTVKKVEKVADLRGLRIRGFGNNIGNALAKYLNFANIAISWGEVLPGIQQQTLDGCEVQVSAAYGAAIYEVAPYLALTKHYMLQSSFVCSVQLLNSMPEADRKFFIDTFKETAKKYNNIIASEEETYYKQMEDKKMTITRVNIEEFERAIAPLYTNNDLGFSPGLKDRLFQELGL